MRVPSMRPLMLLVISVACWECLVRPLWWDGSPLSAQQKTEPAPNNVELAKLYEEDQADRKPEAGKAIDWTVVSHRDQKRQDRVKELYQDEKLETGADYYHAAMVLQHASVPEDFLLAHEFCVVAIVKGDQRAKWLAAATEDRFLMNIKRPQRFGTQYKSDGPDQPLRLYQVDTQVTDGLRRALSVPTLAQAKEREQEIQKLFGGVK